MHLLIVDDEPTICWGLARLGEELGLDVATSSSAEQGLQLAEQRTPDLLFLDVRLPGMSGLKAIEHFRRHMGSAPIVIITAYGDLATAVETVRRGAFEYLVKPFDLTVAQTVIQRALRWRREMLGLDETAGTRATGRRTASRRPGRPIALMQKSSSGSLWSLRPKLASI